MLNRAFFIALLGAFLVAGVPVTAAAGNVSAERGSVGIGGNVEKSTITVGATPEQVKALLDANTETLRTIYEPQVKELSGQLGVTEAALASFFQILREQNVPLEKLPDTLATIAQRFREMQERLSVLNPDDPATNALIEKAQAALESGKFELADALLIQAEDAELTAACHAKWLACIAQVAADQHQLNAASARAERGELSLTRLNYREAAKHFQAATDMSPASAPTARGIYRRRWADALQNYGDQQGDNAALRQAIVLYRQALIDLPRAQQPQQWAVTQNNLGVALATLGEREAGTTRLEEAVAAYRAALAERTRERVPLDWALTQNNLGTALRALGERETGTARLEEAVAAYRAALAERTRERVPLDWALTQNNLGTVLQSLGEREADTARLEEAMVAYRAALAERTRERVPLDWALTQNNLGNALEWLGQLETGTEMGTARLEEAVAAYRAALEECTRERVPLAWAMTQNNLGNALITLGARKAATAQMEEAVAAYRATLEEAVAAYRAALAERTRARAPLDWARTQNNLGIALLRLGAREAGTARLEEAVAAYRAALEELTRERVPREWADVQRNLIRAYRVLNDWAKAKAISRELRAAIKIMNSPLPTPTP